jgi:very-short-patch-repair endonuclease
LAAIGETMRGLHIIEARRARAQRRDAPAAERVVWRYLRYRQLGGRKFVRQEPIGAYIADFVCRESKLVIEIDGATHSTDREVSHDARRTGYLEAQGCRVVRFTNERVFENVEGVLDDIVLALESGLSPKPLTRPLPASGERG